MHLITRNVNTAFFELVETFAGKNPNPMKMAKDLWSEMRFYPYQIEMMAAYYECPTIVRKTSRNGPVLMIEEPVTITYTHPKERVLFNQARDANPFFHLYEALWMLAGRNDVASLAYYNQNMATYSDDGIIFNGAYGYRWRMHYDYYTCEVGGYENSRGGAAIDQLDILVAHLKANPASRRAVLQMWNVEDDLLKIGTTKDNCCNLSVMFSIRDTDEYDQAKNARPPQYVLDMTVTNRSNDAIWGMLGANYVHFTFLQEYMAARIGVEVGKYHHFTNNLHVYENNWKPEEWLAAEKDSAFYLTTTPLKQIPLIRDPIVFEQELQMFVDSYSGKEPVTCPLKIYTEPFLKDVAEPMLIAFLSYKKKACTVLDHCASIKSDDWRIAATNWITKRQKQREQREREKEQPYSYGVDTTHV